MTIATPVPVNSQSEGSESEFGNKITYKGPLAEEQIKEDSLIRTRRDQTIKTPNGAPDNVG